MFDDTFAPVHPKPGAFTDRTLPTGFAPFNVQELGGTIYVAYAKQDADAEDEVAGAGLGYVDAFDPTGRLLRRRGLRGALERALGPRDRPGAASAASTARCSSATSVTVRSTPTTRRPARPAAR